MSWEVLPFGHRGQRARRRFLRRAGKLAYQGSESACLLILCSC